MRAMNCLYKLITCVLGLTFGAFAVYKAKAPEDPKDRANYSFGSLIKDKESFLYNIFHKNSSDRNVKDNNSESMNVKKPKVNPTTENADFEKTWETLQQILSEFPIEFMDKSKGEIKTELVNIESFDITGEFQYQLIFKVEQNGNYSIDIKSNGDSEKRINKLKEIMKDKVDRHIKK
jgi:hypothetical protein